MDALGIEWKPDEPNVVDRDIHIDSIAAHRDGTFGINATVAKGGERE